MANVQVDDQFDLFGGFVVEIEGYLPAIAANMHKLLDIPRDDAPGDEDLLEESHRFAHTIKSSSGMIGLPALRRLAAPMEALLARAYAGDITVDAALVATVDGTLARVRDFLELERHGQDTSALVRDNDQAYATLQTAGPAATAIPSADALDRLIHLDPPVDDVVNSPPAPVESADSNQVSSTSNPQGEIGDRTPERPRLTILPGMANAEVDTHSIAAEWLDELLDAPSAVFDGLVSPPRQSPDSGESAPNDKPLDPATPVMATQDVQQHTPDQRTLVQPTAELEEQGVAVDARHVARLAQAEQAFEAELAAERQNHAAEIERLLAQQATELGRREAAHQRALLEQREALEAQVQHYVEEELRPQLEDEIREELTHEFEVAALLDPAPHHEAPQSARQSSPYRMADDAALVAEMREIFAQEAAEHIEQIAEHGLALRLQPDDPDHLRALRRSVHTLKGAAATVGMPAISSLCHQIESVLDHRLDGETVPADESHTLLLLESCDALEALVRGDSTAAERARELTERLSRVTGVDVAPAERAEAPTIGTPSEITAAGLPAAEAQQDLAPALQSDVDQQSRVVPHQGGSSDPAALALRVSLRELDLLLAANHELIITESTLDQRLSGLQRTLTDLQHAGNRLREAGARLESARDYAALLVGSPAQDNGSEAPALTGRPVSAGAAQGETWRDVLQRVSSGRTDQAEFDALELDRYTEFQRLTREVAEAALDVATSDADLETLRDDLRLLLKQQQRLHGQQNDVLMRTRMVPLQHLLSRLARTVQAIAGQQGKQVELTVDGRETLLDRAVMEEVADALLHLIRNAVDHGVEQPEDRLRAGKPAIGRIHLTAQRLGPEVRLTLTDDGRGLDTGRILRSAMARGLVSESAHLTEHEIQQLIFAPGLSTAATVTDISGRGVGMDVVRANLQAIRGEVDLTSAPGAGTTFTLRVPATLALLTVALVEAAGFTYAIPLTLVRHVERVAARRIQSGEEGRVVRHGGRTYAVIDLAGALGLAPVGDAAAGVDARRPLVFVHSPQGTVALAVDELRGKREVVVKDLGGQLQAVRGVHGATILGTGDLALILDIPALLQTQATERRAAAPAKAPRQRQLLVVDDSPSVRRVTCAVFERQGWQTRPARDGVEALDLLRDWQPDAVVTDIEMPRMDGFELLAILRRQPETAAVPAIMVTSRSGEKHREKATRLGVDAYLVKPFREEELLATVESLLPA